jgi:hypothetical protein
MRYKIGRVLWILVFSFLFSAAVLAQGNLYVNEPAIRIQLLAESTGVDVPVENAGRSTIAANVLLELVDPQGTVQSHASNEVALPPGRTVLHLSLPQAAAQSPPSDPKNLLWYRLRYSVSVDTLPGAARAQSRGIISVSEAAPTLFELHVAAPEIVTGGSRSMIRVRAVHPVTLHPIEGVTVQGSIDLDTDSGRPLLTPEAKTDRDGFAMLNFSLPASVESGEEDQLDVKVTGKLGNLSEEAAGELHINHFSSVLLSTDKPMYQPGQTLHMRLMAFDQDHKAFAKRPVRIEVLDPENALMFRATPQTSRFGVAAADWQIPENIRLGDYQVKATFDEESPTDPVQSAFVKISRYDLPSFSVGVKPDRAYFLPGQNAEIEVRADYLYGEPVHRGHVRVAQETDRQWNFREQKWDIKESSSYEGDTDDQGRYLAHVDLSAEQNDLKEKDYERFRDITFAAYFTDISTGRTEQRRFDVRVSKEPIHVYLISSRGSQPGGPPLEIYLSTDYADGTPAECDVEIGWSDSGSLTNAGAPSLSRFLRRVRTNRYGVAKVTGLAVPVRADSSEWNLDFRARDRQGRIGTQSESVWSRAYPDLRVETNKTLYALNEPIDVELSAGEQDTMVVVEAVHEWQVLASRIVRLRRGHGSVLFPPNEAFQNRVTIVAFGLGATRDDAIDPIVADRTVFFPKNRELNIDIRASKQSYRPGEEISATLHVTGSEGSEKATAVGLVVVDKAVEERAQSDRDFSGNAGFFYFRDSWQGDHELNGVRLSDLDKLDLSKPLPDGLELAADALLQTSRAYANLFTSDFQRGNLQTMFAGEINPAVLPIRDALDQRYQQKQEYPQTEAALKSELAASGIHLDDVFDPWGTPYHARFDTTREMDTLELVSAGPDKKFDTEDDFVGAKLAWPYFKPYSEAIQGAVFEFHARTGGYIRDLETLKTEVARRGIDLESLKDRWGHLPVRVRRPPGVVYHYRDERWPRRPIQLESSLLER